MPFCDSSGRFECPCHGSKYDIGGEWIEGPAPRGMDRYPLAVDKTSGNLVADTSKTITGPPRGTHRFLDAPEGPVLHPEGPEPCPVNDRRRRRSSPQALDRSLDRYLVAGLIFMVGADRRLRRLPHP